MKRLIVCGFACPAVSWEKLFPVEDGVEQKILSFFNAINLAGAGDFKKIASKTAECIESFKPDSIILHDFGVTTGLLALIKIQRKTKKLPSKIIIFNGAFHGFNVFKAPHPIKIQILNFQKVKNILVSNGGEVDQGFGTLFSNIKQLYRQVVVSSIFAIWKKRKVFSFQLESSVLIIASRNDPFIPFENLENIYSAFRGSKLIEINYGHFPYSQNSELIFQKVRDFEKTI